MKKRMYQCIKNGECMKRILSFLMFSLFCVDVFGQDGGVAFMDNEPWENVIKKAKEENKLIFVDCYTIWCGPCNRLTEEVFPQKEMGDYMNHRFVSVKYDIEKGEGARFKELYVNEISAYPTLLIMDTEGKLIHKLVGYQPMMPLMNSIQRGLEGVNVYAMKEKYAQNKNDKAFIKDYLWALRFANMMEEYESVARAYIGQFPMDSLLTKDFWEMASPIIVNDPYCKEYPFVLNNLNYLQYLGMDMYSLEEELDFYMMITVNRLYNEYKQKKKKGNSMEGFEDKVAYLRSLLKVPVRGFVLRQFDLAAIECICNEDVDKLFERMHVFMDCDMIGENDFSTVVFDYLLRNLKDEWKLRECAEYIKNKSGWHEFIVKEYATLIDKRIEELALKKKEK